MEPPIISHRSSAKPTLKGKLATFFPLSNLEHFYRNAITHFSKSQQIRTDVKWKPSDNLTQNKPRRLPVKG